SEFELDTDARDAARNDVGHVTERRPRTPTRAEWRRLVEQIERVEVDRSLASLADPLRLAHPQAQVMEGRQTLRSIRLGGERDVAKLRNRQAAIGINLPEDIGALPLDPIHVLQEPGDRHAGG